MTTVVFNCCDPCRDGRCGQDCGHGEFDQVSLLAENVIPLIHDGCHCTVRIHGESITLDMVIDLEPNS